MGLQEYTQGSSVDENGNAIFNGSVTARGALTVVGAQNMRVTSSSATSYTVGTFENIVLMSSTAARVVTLPDATTVVGRKLTIKEVGSTTSGVAIIAAAGNVDGGTTTTISTSLGKATLASDGSNWWSI